MFFLFLFLFRWLPQHDDMWVKMVVVVVVVMMMMMMMMKIMTLAHPVS